MQREGIKIESPYRLSLEIILFLQGDGKTPRIFINKGSAHHQGIRQKHIIISGDVLQPGVGICGFPSVEYHFSLLCPKMQVLCLHISLATQARGLSSNAQNLHEASMKLDVVAHVCCVSDSTGR